MSEITTANAEASIENEQPNQSVENMASETRQPDEIPEKFVGKSLGEIGKSYTELERSFHKISSERADERKKSDELEKKLQAIEARINSQASHAQAPKEVEEEDPLAAYDEEFDSNPKEAIKKIVKNVQDRVTSTAQRAVLEAEARTASEYYHQQKKDNPDFAKLEPKMQQLAQEYGDLVDPRKINSTKAIKLLHLAARGANVDDYVSEAASRAKKEVSTIREEKKKAFSEGSSSEGSTGTKPFSELSMSEMEKLLGRSDR